MTKWALGKQADPENPKGARYMINAVQYVEVLPLPDWAGREGRLDHIAFNTDNADGMRKYLVAKGWKTPASVERGKDGSRWFDVLDPEGNRVRFLCSRRAGPGLDRSAPNAIGHHIIHVGMLGSRPRRRRIDFISDLLGFRPYWWGGRDPAKKPEWVSQQVS